MGRTPHMKEKTMFSRIALTATLTAMTLGFVTIAEANPHNARYRRLDDLAFSAFVDARELRWEIHDDFVDSADYDHLLRDADEIISALQDLQNTIYRERPDQLVVRDIEIVHRRLHNLSGHLDGCDFMRNVPERYRSRGRGGYEFTPETQSVGVRHVNTALRMIARIESSLDRLQRELRIDHRPRPAVEPRPATPVPPVLLPRGAQRQQGRHVEIPIGGSSGVVFKVRF